MTGDKSFDVVFEVEATATGKMRNEVDVVYGRGTSEEVHFDIATDEGGFHGGDASAPPPLAYFSAALAGCLMTQIRAFSKRLRTPVSDLHVKGSMYWRGTQTGREPYRAQAVGFVLDITLTSESALEDLRRLIDASKKGCFVEQTISPACSIQHRLKTDQGWVDV